MKFVHLADLHIGKRVNDFSMIDDQKFILKAILNIIKKEKAHCVIISGDVYDKSVPPSEAVSLLDDFLTELLNEKLQIFIISGNHDNAERLSFGSRAMDKSGLHISPVFDGNISKYEVKDEYGKINVYLLPFVKPANVKNAYDIDDTLTYTQALKEVVQRINVDSSERNILVSHQFVTGAIKSDSEEITVGGLDNVDVCVYDGFDYVALGHIHKCQSIGKDTVRYSGTPLKYSFSEANHKKSVTIVDFGKKGDVSVEEKELIPLHDMREIKGTFEELTDIKFYSSFPKDDYLHITLTDENDIVDAIGKLRNIYPNIMRLDYDNMRTKTTNLIGAEENCDEKSPVELFAQLYKLQYNDDISHEQEKFITEIAQDIWG